MEAQKSVRPPEVPPEGLTVQKIQNAIDKLHSIRQAQYDVSSELVNLFMNYKGSLIDAYKLGLIRLNFPTPEGFRAYLKKHTGD